MNFSTSQLSEAQERAKIKTLQGLVFQILEVTLPKQKIKIFKRCQMTALKFRFRTITFQKGHWNYLMHKITFNGANFFYQNLRSQGHSYNILFHKHSKTIQGVPKKTRISENVRHKHNTTFLKEPKCFYKQNMFDSSQGNKFWTIKHALIFKTIVFEEKSCVLCITIISLILVFLGHPAYTSSVFRDRDNWCF